MINRRFEARLGERGIARDSQSLPVQRFSANDRRNHRRSSRPLRLKIRSMISRMRRSQTRYLR